MRRFWSLAGFSLAVVLAACSTGGGNENLPPTAPSITTVTAQVYTAQSGCKNTSQPRNDQTVPGFCWLPLYPTTSTTGSALNEGGPDSSCFSDGPTNEGCWPQPGTELELVCQRLSGSTLWFGAKVPAKQILTPPSSDLQKQDLIGFAESRFFQPSPGTRLGDLSEDCTL